MSATRWGSTVFLTDTRGAPIARMHFWKEAVKQGLPPRADLRASREAHREEIERFHKSEHVERVRVLSHEGYGSIDYGDTPAYHGVYEASANVVGAALDGLAQVMNGECYRTFQPIGGLHHARRSTAAGFCVFNDCGVVIDTLRKTYGVKRVAYVDIDVHHGDGFYYPMKKTPISSTRISTKMGVICIRAPAPITRPGRGRARA